MKRDGTAGGVTRLRGIMEKGRTALTALFLRQQFGQEDTLRREFGRKTALSTMRIRPLTGNPPRPFSPFGSGVQTPSPVHAGFPQKGVPAIVELKKKDSSDFLMGKRAKKCHSRPL